MPVDEDARIETEIKRGIIQIAILSMAKEKTYGYRLGKALSEHGLSIEEGTLYPILRRMEKRGLLESLWELAESRPRKYYVLTDDGRATLKRLTDSWVRIRGAVDQIVEGS